MKTIWVGRCGRCDEDTYEEAKPPKDVIFCFCYNCNNPIYADTFKEEEIADVTGQKLPGEKP